MEKRVMIVGGSGNISTGIVRLLLETGFHVSIFTRGTSELPVPADVEQVKGDRSDRQQYIETMRKGRYDYAIDMICMDPESAAADIEAFPEVATASTSAPRNMYSWTPTTGPDIRLRSSVPP